jgi:hypothetical protein
MSTFSVLGKLSVTHSLSTYIKKCNGNKIISLSLLYLKTSKDEHKATNSTGHKALSAL